MTKDLWINLPVKDLAKSKAFFKALGFSFNEKSGTVPDFMACLLVGNKSVVMLCEEPAFKGFNQFPITDTKTSSEVLFSFDAESREEVDELARKVTEAGGVVFGKPSEHQGWMYGCGFSDLDGHRWNILYMDYSKLPK